VFSGVKDPEKIVEEVDKLFKAADIDGNGELDYSEWQIATINKRNILQEDKLRGAFELFDKVLLIDS
jgi:calcium-dependent protein kinase